MSLPTLNENVENVSQLSDLPNDNDGLTSEQLKAVFDAGNVIIKRFINEVLVPALETAISEAAIGVGFNGVDGSDITDHSITSDKLSNVEGSEAVATQNIQDTAVTQEKLSLALQAMLSGFTSSIQSLQQAVATKANTSSLSTVATTGRYSDLSGKPIVDTSLNGSSSNAISNSAVYNKFNSQNAFGTIYTLASGKRSWTLSVPEIRESSLVFAIPKAGKAAEFYDNGIAVSTTQTGKATIYAKTTLAENLDIELVVINV